MIIRIIFNALRADVKFIARDPMLLIASVAPLFLIVILRLVFPPLAAFVFQKTGFHLADYYSIVAITIVSVIPMLTGMVYAFILLDENDQHILQVISVTPAGRRNFIIMRMIMPAFLGLLFSGLCIAFTSPVPQEGWLRNVFIAFLLSSQSTFVFLFIGSLANDKIEGLAFSKFYGIFLIAEPLGLILHHPWSYLTLFSPLYWIAWSWVIPSPLHSMVYGMIAMFLTITGVILMLRHFLSKQAV